MSPLNDALYWFSSLSYEQYLFTFTGLLLLDGPRYLFANLILLLYNFFSELFVKKNPKDNTAYLPWVTALIPGKNESGTIYQCLESIYGTYPYLQIIVIDDGSTDNTYELAKKFADKHKDVIVLKRPRGGGKSTAQNYAYRYMKGEIILVLDADCTFGDNAIYQLVQPFKDPMIGGSAGSILVRNPYYSICTMFQSFEYLTSILVGRIFSAKIGTLSIISGAFGAFRRDLFERGMGMDVGPSEDSDITIRIRKMGYKIAFVPEAECFTDVPVKWMQLWNQRLRWDMGIVRIHIRKHMDNGKFWSNNFRWQNCLYWFDTMLFSVWCTIVFWITLAGLIITQPGDILLNVFILAWLAYVVFGLFKVLTVIYYSTDLKRDIIPCLVAPFYPFYGGLYMRAVRTVAIIDEWLNRRSYHDGYVPKFVQVHAFRWKTKY